MAKWNLDKLNSAHFEGSDTTEHDAIMTCVKSIERKAEIIKLDAQMTPERMGIKMKAEEIMALSTMLRAALRKGGAINE